jgi:hypothetical protein
MIGEERPFLGHPLTQVPDRPRPSWLLNPCQAPALGFPLIELHPNQRIDQVRGLAASGTNPLDDEQGTAGRNVDGSPTAMLSPARRPEAQLLAPVDRQQDPIYKQVGPAERGCPGLRRT